MKVDDIQRWERYAPRKNSGGLACSHPEDFDDSGESEATISTPHPTGEPACGQPEGDGDAHSDPEPSAPSDEHGFPMISPLIERLTTVDVTEVFSPPRVTTEASKFGLKAGEAWDITGDGMLTSSPTGKRPKLTWISTSP